MGAWGAGLYQDDVSCDIKEEYLNRLRVGMSNEEATQEVINYNMDTINDEEDEPLFWFALADTQWKYGRLLPQVKEEALRHIELGENLKRWKEENEKQYSKRKKVLEELKERLNSPQPVEKKITKMKLEKALWNIGDVLAYQIKDEKVKYDKLKDNKWYGKYVLFRVVQITRTNIGSLPRDVYYDEQNVLALYNWVGSSLDSVPAEFEKLEFMKRSKQSQFIDIFLKKHEDELMTIDPGFGKKMGFEVIAQEENYIYSCKYEITGSGITWETENTIDYTIYLILEEAQKKGILNDET